MNVTQYHLNVLHVPIPVFVVDSNLQIVFQSQKSLDTFPKVPNFLDLVDGRSRHRAVIFLSEVYSVVTTELRLQTRKTSLSLFEVHVHRESKDALFLFCIHKAHQLKELSQSIQSLEVQLNKMYLSLVKKKEKLESSIREIEKLTFHYENLSTIGKLAASVAHEIRNPLSTVKGFVQLLQPQLIEMEKGHYAEIALSEIDRANDIIYEFLNATKPPTSSKERVAISQLLEEMILFCQSEATMRNCQIRLTGQPINTSLWIDVKQIKQVILNLIKNALDAIEESASKGNGWIEISTHAFEHNIEIWIEDNGHGMDSYTQTNLFSPFFTTKTTGTGIGLAVCKKIIENHHGKIRVTSTLGVGTIFKISLPLAHGFINN
ncbi:ATP-binding protein [Hazenella coriacea]|uniref:histidine kinase n=1 Tax=Hazenella coriacea TaxID=1179467 RepID=A0A4R3L838_9BACL|nr:ATP-binding protein [Hazenella coriacea]TCS95809.1 signal transduction histidine kinase [Hazenella coriacea]